MCLKLEGPNKVVPKQPKFTPSVPPGNYKQTQHVVRGRVDDCSLCVGKCHTVFVLIFLDGRKGKMEVYSKLELDQNWTKMGLNLDQNWIRD